MSRPRQELCALSHCPPPVERLADREAIQYSTQRPWADLSRPCSSSEASRRQNGLCIHFFLQTGAAGMKRPSPCTALGNQSPQTKTVTYGPAAFFRRNATVHSSHQPKGHHHAQQGLLNEVISCCRLRRPVDRLWTIHCSSGPPKLKISSPSSVRMMNLPSPSRYVCAGISHFDTESEKSSECSSTSDRQSMAAEGTPEGCRHRPLRGASQSDSPRCRTPHQRCRHSSKVQKAAPPYS